MTNIQNEPILYSVSRDTTIVQISTDTSYAMALPAEAEMKEETVVQKISLNKYAKSYLKDFLRREEEALEKVRGRSSARFRMIDSVFQKYGLPVELKYLAVVESYMKTDAVSRVGAKGMWQFMPETARDMGLKVSKKYDERVYAVKSTVAAAKYLRSLYAEFGDWLLVLAAYNGGSGTVMKAIKRSGSRNFWALQRYLPMESRGHVKRYIGTHFYFEGQGGLTTMTKSETAAYMKSLAAAPAPEKALSDSIPAVIAINTVIVADKK